mmetsp:Transcript_59508/g.170801  ORF Transcript_59508/g.170801 Transcript_59508/m.170801 type:complete len:1448 (+) Transcript_59508:107-4450(+)
MGGVLVRLGREWHSMMGGHKLETPQDEFPEPTGPNAMISTFLEWPCLLVYGYFLFAFAIWGAWAIYRQSAHRRLFASPRAENGSGPARSSSGRGLAAPLLGKKPEKPPRAPLLVQKVTEAQGRTITFSGYTESVLGSVASLLVPTTSFALVALFVVLLSDYYGNCEWSWPDQLCYVGTFPIFGSFDTNSYVFLVFWTSSILWFGLLVAGQGGQMSNMFRLHAPLHSSKYVHVVVEEQREVISSGYSRILGAWRKMMQMAGKLFGAADSTGGMFGRSGGQSQTVPLRYSASFGASFIEFRCARYVLDASDGQGGFVQYDPTSALKCGYAGFQRLLEAGGLRTTDGETGNFPSADSIYRLSGPNNIPFEVDSWGTAVGEEFSTFFFLYQFSIYAVCLWFSYWHYTIIAVTVAGFSGLFNAQVRLASQREIRAMMEVTSRVKLLRSGKVIEVSAEEVVPGDIVKVTGGDWPVPCDLLLLRGAAVCDESTLTGESMPVQRLAPTEQLQDPADGGRFPGKHVLVAGTTVLQASGDDAWAVATHTGVYTQKGQLLLLILYPPKLLFKYDEQLVVVFTLLIGYALFVMSATMKIQYTLYAADQKLPLTAMWASGVFTCSSVLPTMLHVVLSVGSVMAAQRLKTGTGCVFCASPKRIALGGKVRVACFDKTGTLTESSLHFFGVHCVRSGQADTGWLTGPFDGWLAKAAENNGCAEGIPTLEKEASAEKFSQEVLCCLASAHSLSPFEGSEAGIVGNAVEVNMFNACGWSLTSQSEVSGPREQKLVILKRFDFSHSSMTMSSVIEHRPSGSRGIYCKGSYEQVASRCLPGSIPRDFTAVAQAHAYSGKYVLAIAGRPLKSKGLIPGGGERFDNREEVEKDLILLGLLLFKNPLRPDTRDTIELLKTGEVRSVMITGDAAGTAICIAREASLVAQGTPVLLGDLLPVGGPKSGGPLAVAWKCSDDDLNRMNELLLSNDWLKWRNNYKQWRKGSTSGARGEAGARGSSQAGAELLRRTTEPIVNTDLLDLQNDGEDGKTALVPISEEEYTFSTEELVLSRLFEWCELAVTQRAWEWLQKQECSGDLRRVLLGSRLATLKKGKVLSSSKGDSSLAWELITSIRIFARMTPTGKISVVEGLMAQGLITSMSGDGGNDSGALRTAHVGMALSSATSATVVAPFTTNQPSVAPLVGLLREGRGALATSFAGYKYCVHYGLLNSTFKFIVVYFGVCESMSASYLQDLVGFLSFSWALSLSRPAKILGNDRPTSSLFSLMTVSSVVGMWVINTTFMLLAMHLTMSHEEYVPFPIREVRLTHWWKRSRNWEATTAFLMYTFQQFWSAVVFSFGRMFRESWYDNISMLVMASGGLGFMFYLIVAEPSAITRAFHLVYEPVDNYEPWSPEHTLPAMPRSHRRRLLAIVVANLVAVAVWEQAIVFGAVSRYLRERWRALSKHVTLRL